MLLGVRWVARDGACSAPPWARQGRAAAGLVAGGPWMRPLQEGTEGVEGRGGDYQVKALAKVLGLAKWEM